MEINSMKKVTIDGNIFNNSDLEIFPIIKGKTARISNIYGKNGSGKSTISKAIDGKAQENISIKFWNMSDNEMIKSDTDKIYVYNETFIDENVKMSENGIKTIIMLGEQKELDDKIAELKKEKDNFKKVGEKLAEQKLKYEDINEECSCFKQQRLIENLLKSGWATRDKDIKGNSRNSSFNYDELIDKVLKSNDESKTKENLFEAYQQLLETYKKTSGNNKYDNSFEKIRMYSDNFEQFKFLMEKRIDKPEFTKREKLILSKIEQGGQKFYESVRDDLKKESTTYCPYCLQDIRDIKNEMVASINKILNQDVDDCKHELEDLKKNFIKLTECDEKLKMIDEKLVLEANNIIIKINSQVDYIYGKIDYKIENIYNVIEDVSNEILNLENELNGVFENLENKRIELNAAITKREKIKETLNDLNLKISWYEIKDLYRIFTNQKTEYDKLKLNIKQNDENFRKAKSEIIKLESEKQNVKIANDKINIFLEYIFISKDRLKIEYNDAQKIYVVKSHNRDIKPKDLSTGERNIIALCYFFIKILENTSKGNEFKEECLVILDDPISSFDLENKIGLYTFLRMMFNKILYNNENSKVLNFTHSLETMFNLEKICSDIKIQCALLELVGGNIIKFPYKRNDYKKMLDDIYCYACISDYNIEHELDDFIGNTMRRLLEAYSTFNYNESFESVTRDKRILDKINKENQKQYFENFMYRLVLNSESHTFDETRSLDFFDFISREEKVKTAKSILILLYLLDKVHLEIYFSNNDIISTIESWEEEIIPKT